MLNIYAALALELGVTLTVIFVTAVSMILLYNKYGRSLQLMIATISGAYALLMSQLLFGAFGLQTFLSELQKLQNHPGFTTALAFGAFASLALICVFRPTLTRICLFMTDFLLTYPILGWLWGDDSSVDFGWKFWFTPVGLIALIIVGAIALPQIEFNVRRQKNTPPPNSTSDTSGPDDATEPENLSASRRENQSAGRQPSKPAHGVVGALLASKDFFEGQDTVKPQP